MDKEIEKEWVEKMREGDERAFERLFRAYYSKIHWFIWGYVGSETVAENLVQDLFTNVWERRQELKAGCIGGYLYRSARNLAIDYLRHKRIERKYRQETVVEASHVFQPDEQLHQQMFVEEIEQAIKALPERRRLIFILSRYNHLTHKQIAELLGISENTVKTQIMRVLDSFREKFSSYLAAESDL